MTIRAEAAGERADEWRGLRWQATFALPGASFSPVIDATTSAEGRKWASEVADRVRDAGHAVNPYQDEGEDAAGEPVMYAALQVAAGGGYVALSFFADEVAWTVEIAEDECSRDVATRVVRDVAATVESVTGYELTPWSLTPSDRALLGRP